MPDWLKRRIQSWRQRIDYPGMSEGEFDTSATKHQEYGVETLGRLLVGTTANSQPQLWDGAVFRIWMMTLATDAYQKRRSKKYKLKIQFFTNGLLANGLRGRRSIVTVLFFRFIHGQLLISQRPRKFAIRASPASWLFSGWNWQARTWPFSTVAANFSPS